MRSGSSKKLEPFDLDAAEQPVAAWDLDGMAELARRVNIPIMADDSLSTPHDLIDIVRRRAASTIQTKQAKNGGIFTARKIWTIADAAGLRVYPGNHPCTSIATAAVVQLAAAWPGDLLDGPFDFGSDELLEHDVVETSLLPKDGEVSVPDAPRLGVTLDEDAIAHFRVDHDQSVPKPRMVSVVSPLRATPRGGSSWGSSSAVR